MKLVEEGTYKPYKEMKDSSGNLLFTSFRSPTLNKFAEKSKVVKEFIVNYNNTPVKKYYLYRMPISFLLEKYFTIMPEQSENFKELNTLKLTNDELYAPYTDRHLIEIVRGSSSNASNATTSIAKTSHVTPADNNLGIVNTLLVYKVGDKVEFNDGNSHKATYTITKINDNKFSVNGYIDEYDMSDVRFTIIIDSTM
jgi:uncharacterized protein YkvS